MSSELARLALGRLTEALTVHLVAVENRSGEHDAEVQAAYSELRAAAGAYDETLYDIHDEVTPFDLPAVLDEDEETDEEPDLDPARLSLLGRWDFTVLDRATLSAAAQQVSAEVDSPAFALTALAATYGPPRITDPTNAALLGLAPHGGTTWVVASEIEPGCDDLGWLEDPFTAEPGDVLCRYDTSQNPRPAPGDG
ncbi:MAG: hypothetical protein ACT4PP_11955 [Sporichthyaceae bacterium]